MLAEWLLYEAEAGVWRRAISGTLPFDSSCFDIGIYRGSIINEINKETIDNWSEYATAELQFLGTEYSLGPVLYKKQSWSSHSDDPEQIGRNFARVRADQINIINVEMWEYYNYKC